MGGIFIVLGALGALAAALIASPPCLVWCSGSSSSGGDDGAAGIIGGVAGGVAGLGLLGIIVGVALDVQLPPIRARLSAGPGDVGLGLDVAS